MEILWSPKAQTDLENVFDYISEQNFEIAYKIYQEIIQKVETLSTFPYSGKPGRLHNTREHVLSDLSYVIVYRIHNNMIYILRLLHSAQKWPH